MSFRSSFYLLSDEGHLIRACLGAGLTDIRNANYADGRGRYYSGFFHLTNGIERMAKITLILHHMSTNRLATPDPQDIRRFGHDLVKLAKSVASITEPRAAKELRAVLTEGIEHEMISFLSRFGHKARYHNIHSLNAGEQTLDPLTEWNSILSQIIKEDIPKKSALRVEHNAHIIDSIMGNSAYVLHHGLDRQPLSLKQAFHQTGILNRAQAHAQVRLFRILKPLGDALGDASNRAQATNLMIDPETFGIPYMSEFVNFLRSDPRSIRTRKRWP